MVAGAWNAQPVESADEFAERIPPITRPTSSGSGRTTVTWSNGDDQIHTVTDVNGAFDSGFMSPATPALTCLVQRASSNNSAFPTHGCEPGSSSSLEAEVRGIGPRRYSDVGLGRL